MAESIPGEPAAPRRTTADGLSIVDPSARIAPSATIGPWCLVGPNTVIGPDTKLLQNVVLASNTILGSRNEIHSFSVLGGDPQTRERDATPGSLHIGDDNVIREHVTVNLGSSLGERITSIGNGNLVMAGCHLGHDASVGANCILASGTVLAGHVIIHDFARLGGNVAVAEWVRIGAHAFVGGQSGVDRDVPPFCVTYGVRPTKLRGCNLRALRKRFDIDTVRTIASIVRVWMDRTRSRTDAADRIADAHGDHPTAKIFLEFVRRSRVGVLR
ncbi:MAG: acyl-ACP--UDP-N-acetylglucosamine O-acyltransferase [Pseudomonadota bacterium]